GSILFLQFWQTFTLDPRRQQVLVTHALCAGLLGNLAATLLSSAGPCYYGYFVAGPDPFAPLMVYLESVSAITPLPSVLAQGYLWESYQRDALTVGAGISAMPSIHMSMAFLLVLACWHRGRWLRGATLAYLVVLQIGSVHLGWHYAIDGYVGIFLTGAIWWLVSRLLTAGTKSTPVAAAPE
ncbi:MAG TPA: phosphatase PAP2 family protein, partial [Gammaproteobacteria bacterium]|nr:phosphatase PAP2 family protein [Gammaproteobacteria bacterium]